MQAVNWGWIGVDGHVHRPDARVDLITGGKNSNLSPKHRGVHGPAARSWKEQMQANYQHPVANKRQRMQNRYRHELQQGDAEFDQGTAELDDELRSQRR